MFGYFGLLEPYVNCHKILDEDPDAGRGALWLGDYQAALDKVSLKQRGIKTILSVVSGIDVRYDKRSQITHHIFWVYDSPDQDISQYFEETFQNIEDGLSKGSVLVHCVMGISRSASIVIAYLMKRFGYTYAYAYNFVKKRRVIICPNFGFSRQLKLYEQQKIQHPQTDLLRDPSKIYQYQPEEPTLQLGPVYTQLQMPRLRSKYSIPKVSDRTGSHLTKKGDSQHIKFQNLTFQQALSAESDQTIRASPKEKETMFRVANKRKPTTIRTFLQSNLPSINIVSFNAQKRKVAPEDQDVLKQ